MKLYRSRGSIWTGTQADAKTAQGGPGYEPIEVPTDKPGILNFLNTFDIRPGDGTAAAAPVPEPAFEDDVLGDPEAPVVHRKTGSQAQPAADCPACLRSKRVATMSVNATAALSIKADLGDVSDPRSLREIIRLAEERLAAL